MVEEGDEFWEKRYPAFIVNKCLSGLADAVLFANEMNCLHWLDNKLQYDFYLHGLPKKKRFAKWMRASKLKDLDQKFVTAKESYISGTGCHISHANCCEDALRNNYDNISLGEIYTTFSGFNFEWLWRRFY